MLESGSLLLLVLLAMGLALQPWAILAAVLLNSAKGGAAKATAFLGGWIAALTTVSIAGVVLLPAREASKSASSPHFAADIVLGAVLAATLVWRWRRAPATTDEVPRWVGRVDTMSPVLAVFLGAFLPSYTLVAAAVNQLLEAGWTGAGLAGAIALFIAVASLGVSVPLALAVFRPDLAPAVHRRWRDRLLANRRLVAFATTGLFAVLLMIKGAAGLLFR
ncbi:GAP family protein [Actinomadura macrotermitis]|nr:GAP family protein [Actinomadura macrotermitis]